MPIGEADKSYVGAALRSVWFYISVGLGLIGLLERWHAMPFLVPHSAILLLIVLSLIGAHFQLYKKKFNEARDSNKRAESESSIDQKIDFDFNLCAQRDFIPTLRVRISQVQVEILRTSGVNATVWNKGKNHLTITRCKLSTEESVSPITINTDIHIHPSPAESQLEITQQLARLLFPHGDWQKIKDEYRVKIEIDCEGQDKQHSNRAKSYKLGIGKPGGFNLVFAIEPIESLP
jgi:hypothetical protein